MSEFDRCFLRVQGDVVLAVRAGDVEDVHGVFRALRRRYSDEKCGVEFLGDRVLRHVVRFKYGALSHDGIHQLMQFTLENESLIYVD